MMRFACYGAPIENLKAAVKAEGLSSMDKWRLSRGGVRPIPNDAVRKALGF